MEDPATPTDNCDNPIRKSKRKRVPTKHLIYDDGKSSTDAEKKPQKKKPKAATRNDAVISDGNLTRANILVKKAYDKVRRNHATLRHTHVKSLWTENLKKLGENLKQQSDKRCSSIPSPRISTGDLIQAFQSVTASSSSSGTNMTLKIYQKSSKSQGQNLEWQSGKASTSTPKVGTKPLLLCLKKSKNLMGKRPIVETFTKITSPIITLPTLSRIPPVLAWTSIPYNIYEDDGKFLTNIPFLGDEVIDKDKKFIDDMVNLYQGKIHAIPDDRSKRVGMDDDIFYDLVQALSEIERESVGIFLEDKAKVIPEIENENVDSLNIVAPTIDETLENSRIVTPSIELFSAIASTFKDIGSGDELRERCEALKLKKQEVEKPPLPIMESGVPQQHPSSYFIPNVEGDYAKDLPKEFSMHAYQFLFCRRCYQYDCPRGHNGDDHIDLKYYKQTRNPQSFNINHTCENENCYLKTEIPVVRNRDEILSEWTPGDKSMFRSLIDSFPNPCYVANLMLNKTCQQVNEFANLDKNGPVGFPTNDSEPPTPEDPLEKPSTEVSLTSLGSRKRSKPFTKKSSSVSKKNLARRWINNVKRTEKKADTKGGIKTGGVLPSRFMPCQHDPGVECDDSNPQCYCGHNGSSCEKFCTCPATCKRRFPGCRCTSTCDTKRCVCFFAARECDPDLCTGCGAHELRRENITCRNVNIQRRLHKHLLMGRSDVAGWGIFIKEDAQRGDFIAEYRGEIISHDESERRGHVYDKIQHTFLFELNDHFVVDATRKGNKSRFVNSSKNPNCEVKRMLVNGDHRIGIYAKRYIEAGEELFYDYEDVLEKQQKVAAASAAMKNLSVIPIPSTSQNI